MTPIKLKLYKNSSAPNKLRKTITLHSEHDVYPRGECNTASPVFEVDLTGNTLDFDYAQIPTFNNWYYFLVRRPTEVRKNVYRLEFKKDVLTSNPNIANCQCIAARNETNYNKYLIDSKLKVQNTLSESVIPIKTYKGRQPIFLVNTSGKSNKEEEGYFHVSGESLINGKVTPYWDGSPIIKGLGGYPKDSQVTITVTDIPRLTYGGMDIGSLSATDVTHVDSLTYTFTITDDMFVKAYFTS